MPVKICLNNICFPKNPNVKEVKEVISCKSTLSLSFGDLVAYPSSQVCKLVSSKAEHGSEPIYSFSHIDIYIYISSFSRDVPLAWRSSLVEKGYSRTIFKPIPLETTETNQGFKIDSPPKNPSCIFQTSSKQIPLKHVLYPTHK